MIIKDYEKIGKDRYYINQFLITKTHTGWGLTPDQYVDNKLDYFFFLEKFKDLAVAVDFARKTDVKDYVKTKSIMVNNVTISFYGNFFHVTIDDDKDISMEFNSLKDAVNFAKTVDIIPFKIDYLDHQLELCEMLTGGR